MPSQSLHDIHSWIGQAVAQCQGDPETGSPLLQSAERFLGHALRVSAQSPSWASFLSRIPARELQAIAALVPAGAARGVMDAQSEAV
jgi:hypothetical protein